MTAWCRFGGGLVLRPAQKQKLQRDLVTLFQLQLRAPRFYSLKHDHHKPKTQLHTSTFNFTSPPPSPSPSHHQHRTLTTMSDDAYAAFLARANKPQRPPSPPPSTSTSNTHTPHFSASTSPSPESYLLSGPPPSSIATYLSPTSTSRQEPSHLLYTSETDAPFLPITLPYTPDPPTTHLPTPAAFLELLKIYAEHPSASDDDDEDDDGAEFLTQEQFDPRGTYGGIYTAVGKACAGRQVGVYRVPGGRSKVEYFIVGVERAGEAEERGEGDGELRLVGVRTLAVES
ncbi:hypothetical protein DFH27DRAFT_527478 [Peziza echinospora]|nr:hypothetical protein DFH27DRAFT_527478 [Peziza echinospora]